METMDTTDLAFVLAGVVIGRLIFVGSLVTAKKERDVIITITISIILIGLAVLVTTESAKADEPIRLHAGGFGYHFVNEDGTDYNNNHRLVAGEYRGTMAGYFKNSYHRDTFFLGHVQETQIGKVRGIFVVGGMDGYGDKCQSYQFDDLCLLVAIGATYDTKYSIDPTLILFGASISLSATKEF